MIHKIGPFVNHDSNVYLLTGKTNILIDAGTSVCSSRMIAEIDRISDGKGLEKILLTHCHVDHVGGVSDLVSRYGCEVFAGAKDAMAIRTADTTFTLDRMFGLQLHPVDVTDLHHGDIIDIGEHRLSVIDTPGHTCGGISFYDEITGSLFSGDTLFSEGVGRTDFPGGSTDDLRNSIKQLSDIEIKSLYPGHGSTTEDGAEAVRIGLDLLGD